MTEYVKAQIIKHALMNYIKRPEATEKDIDRERRLLEYYTERIAILKEKYRIKDKE